MDVMGILGIELREKPRIEIRKGDREKRKSNSRQTNCFEKNPLTVPSRHPQSQSRPKGVEKKEKKEAVG